MLKIITICGEQGVGKTTLFRSLIKKYSQTKFYYQTKPTVNYTENLIEIENNTYRLIDTPSFQVCPSTEIEKASKKHTEEIIKKSDLILWLVEEITEETLLIKKLLQKIKIPKILIRNKIDLASPEEDFSSYKALKSEYFLPVSALKAINIDKLLNKIANLIISPIAKPEVEKEKLNVLIFGPPNSGKSTLMNYLLQENRSLVTSLAGTTQEPVISQWNWKKIDFQLVDTAGITKEQKPKHNLGQKCDLLWAVIDASQPLVKQTLQIIQWGERYHKPLFLIVNKVDLINDKTSVIRELKNRLKSLNYCPIILLSAQKGTGISNLIAVLNQVLKNSSKNFTKKEIEKMIEKMVINNPPPYFRDNKLKIYFAKQQNFGLTPHFVFFVNNPQLIHFSYRRYVINYLRKNFGLEYLPLKVTFKKSV
jgi:GTP-binding protein